MKRLLWPALVAAGCHFGVDSAGVDEGLPTDGGELDGTVELGFTALDANLFDFASAPDLRRLYPDGAMPRKAGYPCAVALDCDNGFCIDGYCCDDLCDPFDPANQCRACNVPGSEGHCVFAEDNTDPRGLCDGEPESTCGKDGRCDGKGNCRLWGAGSVCGPGACAAGQLTAPPTCDGVGHCAAGTATALCLPYQCSGTACATTCTASSGCAAPATCDNFCQCGKSALGGACFRAGDCESGFCSQGVCCSTDCSGACRSCALPGGKGLCLVIPAGSDPLDQCTAQPRASCAFDGSCDGNGACRRWSNTTQCLARACKGDRAVAPRFCDGSGTCLPGAESPCDPYTCEVATGACFGQPCSSNANCAAGGMCNPNGKCSP